jgi:hypothetical protein
MADPFPTKPISTLRTSPIGIVPKHDGGWRLITHLSYPPGQGVNSFIDQEDCSVIEIRGPLYSRRKPF